MVAEGEAGARREAFDVDTLIGTVMNGRFHIIERIARGGMANVYFATQTPLDRPVAVKVLHGVRNVEAESEDSFRGRFLQEASILAKLQHPNIVVLLDYGQIDDFPGEHYFMAMEYLRGETLAQRFRAHGRLSIEESIRLTRQIGRGLREAHRSGFVHRDLKPSNIILVPEDEDNYIAKLVDFGVGKVVPGLDAPAALTQPRADEEITRAGLLLGSPRYMSPEQIRSRPIELRTDIYALGVILFQALTGRLPFEAHNEVDLLMAHCLAPAPEITALFPDAGFPISLSKLVAGMLEKQPEDRPKVEEFLEELALIEDEVFGSVNLAGPTLQSLIPGLPASRRRQDSIPPGSGRSSSIPTWRARKGEPSLPPLTTQSDEPAPRKRKKLLLLALPLLLLPLLLWLFSRSPRTPASAVQAASAPSQSETQAVASASPPIPSAASPTFELTIDSEPAQASVSEGGIVLGRTPLSLTIDHDSVRNGPRHFMVRREGYAPFALEQGDSSEPVRRFLQLVPGTGSSGPSVRSRHPAKGGATNATKDASPSKRGDGPSLDIRLRR